MHYFGTKKLQTKPTFNDTTFSNQGKVDKTRNKNFTFSANQSQNKHKCEKLKKKTKP
jgi:hypothetical protein